MRVDNKLRPRIGVGRSVMIFPKLSVFGYYEYQIDLGFVDDLPMNKDFTSETVWSAGAEYMLSRNFSLMASYDNRFGAPELSTLWQDPQFDASQRTFYYVRVLEIPTPRHSTMDAVALQEAPRDRYPTTIQERAYTSPVWYTP